MTTPTTNSDSTSKVSSMSQPPDEETETEEETEDLPPVSVEDVVPGVQVRRKEPRNALQAFPSVDPGPEYEDDESTEPDPPKPQPAPEPPKPTPKSSQSMASKRKRSSIINDLPHDELKALADSGVEMIQLKVNRRDPAGRVATVHNGPVAIRDLFDGKFDTYLFNLAGGSGTGGAYEFHAADVQDPLNSLNVPGWRSVVPGQPKDPRHNTNAATPYSMAQGGYSNASPNAPLPSPTFPGPGGISVPQVAYQTPGVAVPTPMGQGQVTAPPQDQLPAWARAYPAVQQWPIYYQTLQQTGRLPAGASVHSDMLAQGHAQTWQIQHSQERAENAKLMERLTALEKQARDRETALQKEIEEMRAQRDREKYEGQIAALNAKIDSMATAQQNKPADYSYLSELAKLLGPALAAGLPAFISMLSDRARIESERQYKTMELSQGQQQQLLALMSNNKDNTDWPKLITALGTTVGPVIANIMANNSPQAIAELADMNHQSKLMTLKMMNDLLLQQAEMANPDEPSWMPAFRAVLESLSGVGGKLAQQAAMKQNGLSGVPQQPQPPQRPSAQMPPGQQPTPEDIDQAIWNQLAEQDAQAAANTRLVLDQPEVQAAGFYTHEWRILLFNVHAKAPVDEVAEKMVDHLQHLYDYQILPPPLLEVFDKPRASLQPVLMALPAAREDMGGDPAYVEALLNKLVELIGSEETDSDGFVDAEPEPEEPPPNGEAVPAVQ